MNENIDMNKVFELLEELGYSIEKESWYDEDGVEMTRITTPTNKEYCISGWGNYCDIEDLISEIKDNK